MNHKLFFTGAFLALILLAGSCSRISDISISKDDDPSELFGGRNFTNFILTGEAMLGDGASAGMAFHVTGASGSGYEILFHNGPVDGTRKTGSLASVRNLYRSLVEDGEWFPFEIAVRQKNISVKIDGTDVVCYTQPENVFRIEENTNQLLGKGHFVLRGYDGTVSFRDLKVMKLGSDAVNPYDTLPPVQENNDHIIHLQQKDFPVIDWHVHIKGGLTAEMAEAYSMVYGINYGVGPNAYGPMQPGEGGYGTMYTSDEDLGEYFESVKNLPFLRGVQGEGRKWSYSFSDSLLSKFDYLYTDAMTIYDHKGRLTRLYHPEEVIMDVSEEEYMDRIVDQTVKILSEEPADIFANPFYLPDVMAPHYDKLWTDARIFRVLDVMKEKGIAMEINARYKIPSRYILRRAKFKGIKFTFGTNNMGPEIGRLEYCCRMIDECELKPRHMWYPVMSTRSQRVQELINNHNNE